MHTLQNSIPFLHALGYGYRPAWLMLRVRTPGVVIYECGACAKYRGNVSSRQVLSQVWCNA
jgi:hypothetical protein